MGANCSCKDTPNGNSVEAVDAKQTSAAEEEMPQQIPAGQPPPVEPKTLLESPAAAAKPPSEQAEPQAPAAQERPGGPRMTVALVSARGLRNADWLPGTGKSDCYCILKVVGKDQELYRTRVINDTLDPVWSEEVDVTACAPGESLEFCVWDKDAISSNFLGKVVLDSSKFEGCGFNGELRLEDAGKDISAFIFVKVRMAGQEYPEEPPDEFIVSVDKIVGKPLGLDLDIQDSISAYVVSIRDGPFMAYNETAKPGSELQAGDFIRMVNGVQGKGSRLLDQMKQDGHLELLVRRPVEVTAMLARSDQSKRLGIDITNHPIGNALLIMKVGPGLVREWNEHHRGQEVKAGDRVVAVGGQRGTALELKKWLEAPKVGHITVARPAS